MAKAKQLPSGSWRVLVYDGKDTKGKRIYTSFTAPTEKEADYMALDYQLHKSKKSKQIPLTFEQAAQQYIQNRNAVLSPATVREYTGTIKRISNTFTQLPLKKITPQTVQKEINLLSQAVKPKTVKNIHGFISAVLKEYCPEITLHTKLPQNQKIALCIPSEEEITILLASAKQYYPKLYLPILLAVCLGLRRSEICALKWQSIDFHKKTITISNAKVLDENKNWIIKNPKSFSGNRTILLSEFLCQTLQDTKKIQKYAKNDFVLSVKPNTITNTFPKLLKKANLPSFRFHDLRHFHASMMLALNIPDKYAMERMGHATNTMLKTVYQHTFLQKQIEVSSLLNSHIDTLLQHEMQHNKKNP